MPKDNLNFAVIGTGLIGDTHIGAIAQVDGMAVKTVCDVVLEKAEKAAAKHGIAEYSSDLDKVLSDRSIDAVIVAVPNRFHRDVALAVAKAGKHMLLEKPVSHDFATAREVLEACTAAGTIVRVGHNERCWDASILARQIVQSGALGQVLSFRNVFSHSWKVVSIDDYRWNLEISGGATMMDITSHSVDLVRYLIGGDYASIASSLRHSAMPKAVDDNVHLMVEMNNGASGTFASDRFSPTHHFTTDLYGTEGSLHLSQLVMSGTTVAPLAVFSERPLDQLPSVLQENARPRFGAYNNQRKTDGWYMLHPPRRSAYVNQMRAFGQTLRGEKPEIALCTLEDGVHNLEVMHAAYTAQNERRWVELPQPSDAPWIIPHYS
jgi:UDP-N-acetyl-2-amino-2-deoxyglucuronate dehydrogenase